MPMMRTLAACAGKRMARRRCAALGSGSRGIERLRWCVDAVAEHEAVQIGSAAKAALESAAGG
jgi:hypothetical protein